MDVKSNDKEKIILKDNAQREMMKFFLKTSIPKIAADKQRKKDPPNPNIMPVDNG